MIVGIPDLSRVLQWPGRRRLKTQNLGHMEETNILQKHLPDNITKCYMERFYHVGHTVFLTERFHQRRDLVQIVAWHGWEQAVEEINRGKWHQVHRELMVKFQASTDWCSIWKFRCPVNQSLKKLFSTLHVAWSCKNRDRRQFKHRTKLWQIAIIVVQLHHENLC